ncbi:MAG: hypothetical protein WDO15_12960 [Bacteroidota bacterium]
MNVPIAPIVYKGYGTGKFTKMVIDVVASEATGDYRMVSIVDITMTD